MMHPAEAKASRTVGQHFACHYDSLPFDVKTVVCTRAGVRMMKDVYHPKLWLDMTRADQSKVLDAVKYFLNLAEYLEGFGDV